MRLTAFNRPGITLPRSPSSTLTRWQMRRGGRGKRHSPASRSKTMPPCRPRSVKNPLGNRNLLMDTDGLLRQSPLEKLKGERSTPSATSRCGSLLAAASADVCALLLTSSHPKASARNLFYSALYHALKKPAGRDQFIAFHRDSAR